MERNKVVLPLLGEKRKKRRFSQVKVRAVSTTEKETETKICKEVQNILLTQMCVASCYTRINMQDRCLLKWVGLE